MPAAVREIVEIGWADALAPVADRVAAAGEFLRAEIAAGRRYLPAGANILRAFTQPFEAVRVLIVGQDPYPTPGHAVGLSFSVEPGRPGSHRGKGWEEVTEQAIRALVTRSAQPLVAILWGRDACTLRPMLTDVPCIESAHPSPMSADRGFFGSRPFSRANAMLADLGADPVDWALP